MDLLGFCSKFRWEIDGHSYQTPGLVTLYHRREKYEVRLLIEIRNRRAANFLKGWMYANEYPDKQTNPTPKHICFFTKEEAEDLLAIDDWSLPPRDIHNDA